MILPVLESWEEITTVTSLRRFPVLLVARVPKVRQRTLSPREWERSLELGPPGLRSDPCYLLAACRFPHLQNGLSDACLADGVRIKWARLSSWARGLVGSPSWRAGCPTRPRFSSVIGLASPGSASSVQNREDDVLLLGASHAGRIE